MGIAQRVFARHAPIGLPAVMHQHAGAPGQDAVCLHGRGAAPRMHAIPGQGVARYGMQPVQLGFYPQTRFVGVGYRRAFAVAP